MQRTTQNIASIRNAVNDVMQRGPVTIPAFSGAAAKLRILLKDPHVDMTKVTEMIKLDPGLAAHYLGAVTVNPQDKKKTTANIADAIAGISKSGIRKRASAVGVSDHVQHLRAKVHWNLFWLHSVFTARLTEIICKAYRPLTGMEYLAGLLHDSGKAFLEHYFPREFESVVFFSMERRCGMFEAEQKLLGITHPEISAMLCEKWNLHREIVRAVRFHHEPESPFNKDPLNPETEKFLAICVCLADSLANACKANIQGARDFTGVPVEELPGWALLRTFRTREPLDLNLEQELQNTHQAIETARETTE